MNACGGGSNPVKVVLKYVVPHYLAVVVNAIAGARPAVLDARVHSPGIDESLLEELRRGDIRHRAANVSLVIDSRSA